MDVPLVTRQLWSSHNRYRIKGWHRFTGENNFGNDQRSGGLIWHLNRQKGYIVFKIATCSSIRYPFMFISILWKYSGYAPPWTVNVTDGVRFPRHCEGASAASTKGQDWSFYFLSSSQKAVHQQQLLFSTVQAVTHRSTKGYRWLWSTSSHRSKGSQRRSEQQCACFPLTL